MDDRLNKGITKGWLALSVFALVMAGVLAAGLVIARVPPFHHLVTDPLFFKRCLVVHVDLSLFIWFFAFFGFLYTQLPTRKRAPIRENIGLSLACVGVLLLIISAGLPQTQPILSNYLPVIDHPLFSGGLLLFGLGVVLTLLQPRLLPEGGACDSHIPEVVRPGLRAGAVILLAASATAWAAYLETPQFLEATAYYEQLYWGPGHVLQFANVAAMISVWLLLVQNLTGEAPLTQKWSFRLFSLLALPTLAAPLVTIQGTMAPFYRRFFTMLMQWGIFPVTLIFMSLCIRTLWRAKKAGKLQAGGLAMGLYTSFALTLVGFVLGAMIRGSNTLVPAHYHASIGAVTVAYMTATFFLFKPLGFKVPQGLLSRWVPRQPFLFGLGQTIFAVGFGWAGTYGMGRKLYGSEQHIRHMGETMGLIVMGLGGALAIVGGVLFLFIVVRTLIESQREKLRVAGFPSAQLEKRRIS